MKTLIINNLASGYGQGAIYDFIRLLAKDGEEVVLRSTDGTTDIRLLMLDAADFDLVVASGGDGTIATVAYALAGTGVPVLPFPAGTANLLAGNVWLPNEPHALAKLAREGRTLDFDLGELEINGGLYGFSIMAGCGYDAAIMRDAKPGKKIFGPAAYFGAAVSNIAPTHARFRLEIDGETVEDEGVGVLIVNFSKIQFDLSVTHENQPRDGFLDVVVLRAANALELLPAVGAVILDRSGGNPDRADLSIYRGKNIRVESDPPLQIQYDGEVVERTTPFSARVLPGALSMVISKEGYDLFSDDQAQV